MSWQSLFAPFPSQVSEKSNDILASFNFSVLGTLALFCLGTGRTLDLSGSLVIHKFVASAL